MPGSHGDSEVVDRAFAGVPALFWLVPPFQRTESVTDAYVEFSLPASAAIARHGVKQVVTISALGRGTPEAGLDSAVARTAATATTFRQWAEEVLQPAMRA